MKRPMKKVWPYSSVMRRFAIIISFTFLFCSCHQVDEYHKISGETMGTYYTVTFSSGQNPASVKIKIDSLLVSINDDVSTYIPASTISMFNVSLGNIVVPVSKTHFIVNFLKAKEIYEISDGFFDPTVMPLVNYWGFGYTPHDMVTIVDSMKVDSIIRYVGFQNIKYSLSESAYSFDDNSVQLDFSAIAKGYAVDQVGDLLKSIGSKNYMVEIGGEVVTLGVNPGGQNWVIGINTPKDEAKLTDLIEYLSLTGVGLASSGNYRNYHESKGVKYGHTINPKTGFPEKNELLAVSVIADDCMTADALATACMVMGFEKAQNFINNIDDVSACFFTGAADGSIQTVYSNGFIQFVAQ